MALAVGVDVGGTKLAAGLVDASGQVLRRMRRDTPAGDADTIVPLVVELVAALGGDEQVDAVGVGAAGIINPEGVVRYSPNIDWREYPIRDELRAQLGRPVTVDNDANVAAWGEYRVGAGREAASSMVMLTIGTGVGGGLIADDRLIRGAHGMGAEFGHIIVSEGGPRCSCGNRGCLEALASGTAIGRVAAEEARAGTVPADSALAAVPAGELTGKTVNEAAAAGDHFAREVLAGCGFWLGVGLASVVNAVDPELVVVGGGAMRAGDLLLAPARESFVERLLGAEHRRIPPIVAATCGDDAGIVGAALLALASE